MLKGNNEAQAGVRENKDRREREKERDEHVSGQLWERWVSLAIEP